MRTGDATKPDSSEGRERFPTPSSTKAKGRLHIITILSYLAGLAVVQVPELDVSVPHGHKVGAVLREGHARHLAGHLVGRHDYIFLQENNKTV